MSSMEFVRGSLPFEKNKKIVIGGRVHGKKWYMYIKKI
jgi:hypothetical protein